ncbi:MAG: 4-alpha-glucanotransferase [Rhodocyclales bacterium]|nr:4-alpha-glucanotransferase [Rhodocyclales bacterium]
MNARQRFWQILPLTSIGVGNSPYASPSAFAGNPLLIDLETLRAAGWLTCDDLSAATLPDDRVDFEKMAPCRMQCLEKAWRAFRRHATQAEQVDLEKFCAEQTLWLDDYALFTALLQHHGSESWVDWPAALAKRQDAAMEQARREHANSIDFWKFCQWCFRRQWLQLKAHANECGIDIIGDMPIFVAHNSADVWAHPELFELREDGHCRVIAGVPPDVFNADGQCWGNPLYRWDAHAREGYRWWVERFRTTLQLVNVVRIDHFRGFSTCWELPAEATTGRDGTWREAPGAAVFSAIVAELGSVPAIAEDPGVVIPEVDALRRQFSLPGMRMLQFAFNGEESTFLPHKHERDAVVYTGTHDNDTVCGWWAAAKPAEHEYAMRYLRIDAREIHWDLIHAASASVANTAIIPLQDVLGLGSEARMNTPGKQSGNWTWRFTADTLTAAHAQRLADVTALYERSNDADGGRKSR